MKIKNPLLSVNNLKVAYFDDNQQKIAVNNISFALNKAESLGIIGESGSGKTTIAMALMGLLTEGQVSGDVIYQQVCLNKLKKRDLADYRWRKIALVFQNSLEVLNPVLTIKEQIVEAIKRHKVIEKNEIDQTVKKLFKDINLDEKWLLAYPHELSGGMRQKVLIAMALSCQPELLIVDEPTSSLDARSKKEIVDLLKSLQKQHKFSMIVISHELTVIKALTTKLAVLYNGSILETGLTKEILLEPMHVYSRGLVNASSELNPYQDLWGIPEKINSKQGEGCPFYQRCYQAQEICKKSMPKLEYILIERQVACHRGGIIKLLHVKDLSKTYSRGKNKVVACDHCSLEVKAGEVVALIGESGSGKTTMAKMIAGFLEKDSGEVYFDGSILSGLSAIQKSEGLQIVFQDPLSSVNSRLTVEQVVKEPLEILNIGDQIQRLKNVKQVLKEVQLPDEDAFLNTKCHALSGGQRQRVSIARSLVLNPKLLIADEITSMLDASTKANLLRLIKQLQNNHGFSMLIITHDLPLARKIADRVYIMKKGKIIEKGNSLTIFDNPQSSYAKILFKESFL